MHPAWEQLADYVDKRLSETEADQITRHLTTCEQCARDIEWLDDTTHLLRTDSFVAPPRTVRMAAELAFEQRFPAPSPVVAPTPPLTLVTPAPSKVITPPSSYWRRSVAIIATIAAVLILWVVVVRSTSRPLVAAVASSQGQVDVLQGQTNANLFGGSGLTDGSAIRTSDGSTAEIAFWNGAAEVLMLGGSHIVYEGAVVEENGHRQVNLMTDTAGDIDLNAEEDVTIHLQTGIGLVETTGGRFRFHYLEPKIVALNVVRGTVTVTNEEGEVYDLGPGEHILDYSKPHTDHAEEPAATATVEPSATAIPATATSLPTRAAPTSTAIVPTEAASNTSGSYNATTSSVTGGTTSVAVTEVVVATATSIPTVAPTAPPAPTATVAPAPPAEPAPEPEPEHDDNSGSGGGEHSDNSGSGGGSEHDDNSGSGGGGEHSDNSGSGGGGNDHDDNSGSGSELS